MLATKTRSHKPTEARIDGGTVQAALFLNPSTKMRLRPELFVSDKY
jgi:hypothetical protein